MDQQVVVFQLGEESYAIDIYLVQEIKTMSPVTAVPEAPRYVDGVINFRGRVTPVVNMRKRFGMPPKEETKETRIIVVSLGPSPVGLMVDSVSEVMRVPADVVEGASSLIASADADFISGIAKMSEDRLIILLQLEKLLQETVEATAVAEPA